MIGGLPLTQKRITFGRRSTPALGPSELRETQAVARGEHQAQASGHGQVFTVAYYRQRHASALGQAVDSVAMCRCAV